MFSVSNHVDSRTISLVKRFLNQVRMWPMFLFIVYDNNDDNNSDRDAYFASVNSQVQLLRQLLSVTICSQEQQQQVLLRLDQCMVWALDHGEFDRFRTKYGPLCMYPLNTETVNGVNGGCGRRIVQNSVESICNTQYANELVEKELFFGSLTHAMDQRMMQLLNIGAVVTLRRFEEGSLLEQLNDGEKEKNDGEQSDETRKDKNDELPGHPFVTNCDKWMQVIMNENEEVVDQLDQVVTFIDEYLKSGIGKAVLVHDTFGITHSTVFVVAYFIKVKKMNMIDAIDFVKSKRIISRVPMEFMEQLALYEIGILG